MTASSNANAVREQKEKESAENAEEAKKRESLQFQWDKVARARARKELNLIEHQGDKQTLVNPDWQYVGPDVTDAQRAEANQQFGLSSSLSQAGLFKDGLYRSTIYPGMDILLDKGIATAIGGKGYSFEQKIDALFSFLAVAKGTNEFVYDFKSVDTVDMDKVKTILKIAEEKGYTVELGDNIQKFLLTNKQSFHKDYLGKDKISDADAQKRRTEIYQEVIKVNSKAAQTQEDKGIKDKIDHYRFKAYADALKNEDKVQGRGVRAIADAAYKKDEDPKKHAETNEKKVVVAIDEIKDIQDRLKQLDEAKKALNTDLDTWEKRFKDANALTNPEEKAATKEALVEKYEKAMAERSGLMAAIETEHWDLISRRDLWKQEIEGIKATSAEAAEDSPLKKSLTEAERELSTAQKTSEELGEQTVQPAAEENFPPVENPLPDTAYQKVKEKLDTTVKGLYDAAKLEVTQQQQLRSLGAS